MQVGDLNRLTVLHDLDATLVHVALREHPDTLRSADDDRGARRLHDFAVAHLRDVTGLTVVVVVIVAVPFMPGFRSRTVTGLPSTVNWKSSGTVIS